MALLRSLNWQCKTALSVEARFCTQPLCIPIITSKYCAKTQLTIQQSKIYYFFRGIGVLERAQQGPSGYGSCTCFNGGVGLVWELLREHMWRGGLHVSV